MAAVSPASPPVSPSRYRRDSNGGYPTSPITTQTQQLGLQKHSALGSIQRKSVPNSPTSIPSSPIQRKSVPNSPIHKRQLSYPLNDIDEMSAAQHKNPYPSPTERTMAVTVMQGTVQQYQQQLPHFSGSQYSARVSSIQSTDSRDLSSPDPEPMLNRHMYHNDPALQDPLPSPSFKPQHITQTSPIPQPQKAVISSGSSDRSSKSSSTFYVDGGTELPISGVSSGEQARDQKPAKMYPQLQYHHQQQQQQPQHLDPNQSMFDPNGGGYSGGSNSPSSDEPAPQLPGGQLLAPQAAYRRSSRPTSTYSVGPETRGLSPNGSSPRLRAVSGQSYDSRRSSYMDLTQPAHIQEQHRPVSSLDNKHLQTQVGAFASLLSSKQTLEMYRANAKKTQDPMLQYELAIFMVQLAQRQQGENGNSPASSRHPSAETHPYAEAPAASRKELLHEARTILERIQSKLPQAQYYLADAYSSGLFNKGRDENEKAFPLFVAASKHGHAEAGYRAALCYEFGWGCRKDPLKAVQFFRHAASKSHPGAMTRLGIACLRNDLGLQGRYREGLKWLKRATEIADEQYPSAPYELGLLHEMGYGESVLPDPGYSAQLFTQAADLGHADANFRMGDAYEHGKLNCPRDPALSVHFYVGAAAKRHPLAMMALCAWYLVGAEPVLEKNEAEAYAWALQASEHGLPKAEYAVGYFTEMGIGCRRDPLEANVWYVKAAGHGDERAIARLKIINEAAGGGAGGKVAKKKGKLEKKASVMAEKGAAGGGEKGDCCVM